MLCGTPGMRAAACLHFWTLAQRSRGVGNLAPMLAACVERADRQCAARRANRPTFGSRLEARAPNPRLTQGSASSPPRRRARSTMARAFEPAVPESLSARSSGTGSAVAFIPRPQLPKSSCAPQQHSLQLCCYMCRRQHNVASRRYVCRVSMLLSLSVELVGTGGRPRCSLSFRTSQGTRDRLPRILLVAQQALRKTGSGGSAALAPGVPSPSTAAGAGRECNRALGRLHKVCCLSPPWLSPRTLSHRSLHHARPVQGEAPIPLRAPTPTHLSGTPAAGWRRTPS